MFSPRIALAGALSGAATVASALVLAMPASAAVGDPTTCAGAQSQLFADQQILATARQTDATSDGTVTGAADFTPDAEDAAVATANGHVNSDRGFVNALCGTTTVPGGTGYPHPWPTPTPIPGPVGLPGGFPGGYLNCTQLANRGISNIPVGSVYYRPALDANHDGVACETTSTGVYQTINGQNCHLVNGQWVAVNNPTVVYRVVNGKMCHQVSGQWIPINQVTVAAPTPCSACAAAAPVVVSEPQTIAPPPVYVAPAPTQPVYVPPAQAFTTQIAPAVPSSSAGDGSLAVDPIIPTVPGTITVTLNLNGVLHVISLPTLPVIPTL